MGIVIGAVVLRVEPEPKGSMMTEKAIPIIGKDADEQWVNRVSMKLDEVVKLLNDADKANITINFNIERMPNGKMFGLVRLEVLRRLT